MPHNTEAEMALLGAIFVNNRAYEAVSDFLRPEHFGQVAGRFSVMNIPTLLLFKSGEEVDRIVGVVPKEEMSRRIDAVISG